MVVKSTAKGLKGGEDEVVVDEEIWAGGNQCVGVRDLALVESLWRMGMRARNEEETWAGLSGSHSKTFVTDHD